MTAFGTVGAVLVALLGPTLWNWWQSPRLQISFERQEPYCRDTPLIIENHGAKSTVDSHWVRVKVTNKGRGIAKACKGKMIAVYKDDGALRQDRDPMQLRWAGVPWEQSLEPLDLARMEYQFLGVVYAQSNSPQAALVVTHDKPEGFSKTLEAHERHRVRLAAYADNAKPQTAEFVITYGGDVGSLKMDWA